MSNTINQKRTFEANPESIYAALLDSEEFSKLTGGAPAEISGEVGGAFSLFGGKIVGRNVELVPNRRIVQAWRAADWSEGVYSIIKFEIQSDGSKTRIDFDQSGFPTEFKEHLEGGWDKMYWEPLKNHLNV